MNGQLYICVYVCVRVYLCALCACVFVSPFLRVEKERDRIKMSACKRRGKWKRERGWERGGERKKEHFWRFHSSKSGHYKYIRHAVPKFWLLSVTPSENRLDRNWSNFDTINLEFGTELKTLYSWRGIENCDRKLVQVFVLSYCF